MEKTVIAYGSIILKLNRIESRNVCSDAGLKFYFYGLDRETEWNTLKLNQIFLQLPFMKIITIWSMIKALSGN